MTADTVPQSIEAEHAVLGAVMFSPQDCAEVLERLKPEHFYDGVNARIYATICRRLRAGQHADPVSIRDAMTSDAGLEEMGGIRYLADLYDKGQVWGVVSHAESIMDRSARRAILKLATEAEAMARSAPGSADEVLGHLERGSAEIARESTAKALAVPVGLSALENLEAAWRGDFAGASVGLACLDDITGGIRQDDVWIIGGRTSMGKSVAAISLARGIAQQGRGVLVFSLEMPFREVQARLISDIAYDPEAVYDAIYGGNIGYGDILRGRGREILKDKARAAAKQLASLPIAVTDLGGLTIDEIRSQSLRQVRAWERANVKPGAIIIDHLGLIRPVRKTDNKAADTSDIVNELKAIAKQVRAPVIGLAQINRATESRQDKRPTMSDMNWSGSIEQIADMVCLLYREAYYLERGTDDEFVRAAQVRNDIDLIVTKNRSGPSATLKAHVDVACNALRDKPDHRRAFG